MKKNKFFLRWSIILLCIVSIFFWAIWMAFLQDVVPWKKNLFINYNSFYEKVDNGYFLEELPQSACDIKYYWGNRNFVKVGGYGICLSDDEYKDVKEEAVQRYQYQYSMHSAVSEEKLYLYDEQQDAKWITEEYITIYDIEEMKTLILKDEEADDYYVIASYDYGGGPIHYYSCVLCNDKSNRMIEIAKTDRNP